MDLIQGAYYGLSAYGNYCLKTGFTPEGVKLSEDFLAELRSHRYWKYQGFDNNDGFLFTSQDYSTSILTTTTRYFRKIHDRAFVPDVRH